MNNHRAMWLLAAAVVIVSLPMMVPIFQGSFSGADDQAMAVITQSRPDYQPWFQPLWTPPSGEVASMLFAVQAALGAGFLGYVIGRRHGSAPKRDDHDGD